MTKKKPKEWLLGPLTPGKDAKNYVLPQQNFPASSRWCNAAMPAMTAQDLLRLPRPFIRPGADHSQLTSKGGC